jgi:hypothetical protein
MAAMVLCPSAANGKAGLVARRETISDNISLFMGAGVDGWGWIRITGLGRGV